MRKTQQVTRKIPATMVTQHPDHASMPYWHKEAYISTQFEAEEAYRSFAELGATEYKWDWEGKLVDESVVERLFGEYFSYFSKNPIGEKVFLTFRLPNPRIETEFRLLRAFSNMASAAAVAKHFGFRVPPLFEVILPMTESAEEMLSLQVAFVQMHKLKHPLYRLDGFLSNIRIIPLFESVTTIMYSDEILKEYIKLYRKKFKKSPPYMRPYVARSDPALNSGLIPTVLSIKIALCSFAHLEKTLNIPMYPIIGAAALPFRGGLTPLSIDDFITEYPGIRTTTIQSAFRYDFPKTKVIKALARLEEKLPQQKAAHITSLEKEHLIDIIRYGEKEYQKVVEKIAPLINAISRSIPKRRERFLHIGLFGYSRGKGKVKLPRAIGFTASLYSIGIPPELIATGKVIAYAKKKGFLSLLEKYYINLRKDIAFARQYLSKKNLEILTKRSHAWKEVLESVLSIEEYLGQRLKPKTSSQAKHVQLSEQILTKLFKKEEIGRLIHQAAILRKSLG